MERLQADLDDTVTTLNYWSPPISGNFFEFRSRLEACDVVISERLHGAVLAAAHGIPFVSIGYKGKCMDFASSIDMTDLCLYPENLSSDNLATTVLDLLRSPGEITDRLDERVGALRYKLRSFAGEIVSIVDEVAP